ncbi:Xaa-Pro dipeptidase [Thalassotalea fonticola]|uniref:Xaa-Pro dipeptidase n=1 Tax=Thalassotalea fonticola TaxID=3065649 RepID=A0ABZ0GKT1_9GAMM|nr:Xaa-Pro dipeptidase [Colwelliaceae bacterium S1-1]
MKDLAKHYPAHIAELQQRTAIILERENINALVIHAGQVGKIFLDDMYYPFKTNPHFKAWLPIIDTPNCWLIVNGKDKPVLAFYQPTDFWHKVTKLADDYWTAFFDIKLMSNADDISAILPSNKQNMAYIGAHQDVAQNLGFELINPELVLNYFHYHRAYKTEYDLVCLREANRIAVVGHNAAKDAFYSKASEFEIQLAYLQATGQGENEMPYGNIIALNENAAILHYTVLEQTKPLQHHSFLIDAGANFNGYAADITRTYAFEENEFQLLIMAMNEMQLELGQSLKANSSYVDLHITNHYKLAAILKRFELVNLEPEAMVAKGITSAFYPHGLGHHLGLQVHDMGGFMADETGTHVPAPAEYPFLRTSRDIESKQVFTIEPGLYFIDQFLTDLSSSGNSKYINWAKVDSFRKFGGIRIEDNIIVHDSSVENMTRDCKLS